MEGIAPDSIEAQVIADLKAEGHELADNQPIDEDGNILPDEKPDPKPVADKPDTPVEPPKGEPDRTPTMVEAWKLKVAEDQKAKLEAESSQKIADLESKLQELSTQTRPITETQKENIADDIKAISEESGVDEGFLNKFAETILKKAEQKFKPSDDITNTLKAIAEEKELLKQETEYSNEFAKDIEPLVKEYALSDTALSQLKDQLKDLAFSDTYAKVPLSKIFRAEFDSLGLKEPKRSSEGKGPKMRANEIIDFDNLTDEQFSNLTDEQLEKFNSRNSTGWNTNKK